MAAKFKSIFHTEMDLYLVWRKEELSSEAFRHNKQAVYLFDDYLCRIDLKEKSIDVSIVEGWIKEIGKDISLNTVNAYINYLRQLLRFFTGNGFNCFLPETIAKKDTYVPYLYSDQDIENIFRAADSFTAQRAVKNRFIEKEMPLLLRLLLCCGLRLGETVNIKVGDIDFNKNLIILRITKKNKQRLVPFNKELSEIIYLYCGAMGILNDSEAYLFPATDKYTHITSNTVGNYYRIIRKNAGIENDKAVTSKNGRGACIHCFRHTFAVRSFDRNERNGISQRESVPFLSTYLGHDSLYETEKYLKYSGDYFEDTINKFETYAGELFPEVSFDE